MFASLRVMYEVYAVINGLKNAFHDAEDQVLKRNDMGRRYWINTSLGWNSNVSIKVPYI